MRRQDIYTAYGPNGIRFTRTRSYTTPQQVGVVHMLVWYMAKA